MLEQTQTATKPQRWLCQRFAAQKRLRRGLFLFLFFCGCFLVAILFYYFTGAFEFGFAHFAVLIEIEGVAHFWCKYTDIALLIK